MPYNQIYPDIAGNAIGAFRQAKDDRQNDEILKLKKIRGAAKYVAQAWDTRGPEAAAQAYNTVGPFLSQLTGRPMPAFDPAHRENLDGLLATTAWVDGGGANDVMSGNVQSTFVDGNQHRIALLRNGQTVDLGPAQQSFSPLQTDQGVGAFDKGSGTVRPATWSGPETPQSPQFIIDDAALESLRTVPPNERAAALAAMQSNGGAFHAGPDGQPVAGLSPGAMVQAPEKAPAGNPEEFGQPQTVVGPDGKPQLVQFGNQGGQRPVKGLAPTENQTGRVSATQVRQANAAKQKLIDLQSVRNQLALVRQKFQPLQNSMSAGPFGQGYLPSEEGRRYDAAVALLQQQVRKLTRTPGEGSMSDWEGKLALLANPDRKDYESVTIDKIDQLDNLVNQIEQGYQAILDDNQPANSPAQAKVIRYDAQGNRIP
jgi:hypothetical protein